MVIEHYGYEEWPSATVFKVKNFIKPSPPDFQDTAKDFFQLFVKRFRPVEILWISIICIKHAYSDSLSWYDYYKLNIVDEDGPS